MILSSPRGLGTIHKRTLCMIKVQVRPNEPLEAAMRRFKRQCNFAGIFRLAKKYSFFEKRSDKNRREDRERIRTRQRAQRKLTTGRGPTRRKTKSRSRGGRPDTNEPEQTAFADTGKPREKVQPKEPAAAAAPSAESSAASQA